MKILKEGLKAPDFKAKNQNGQEISLSDYKDKEVILYFYPKDNTPTCTVEACEFRDNYQMLAAKGFEVIGVSDDSEKVHQRFITKYQLPFNLIADTDHKIIDKYGVWAEKQMYGRTYMGILRKTFIIGKNGKIRRIIDKVDSKNATQQVLDSLSRKKKAG